MTCFVSGCGGHVKNRVCQKCGTPQETKFRPTSKPQGGDDGSKKGGDKKGSQGG